MGQTPLPTAPSLSPGFAIRPYAPRVGMEVQFTDYSANAVEWWWQFGDGATSSEKNPTHIYTTEGEYTVTLIVVDVHGTTASLQRKM